MADFEWYRSFLAVYRLDTVSAAAVARALTQPAVSQHLAALEAALGYPLFKRTPRRMVPTEQGQALYSQIVQAIDQLEAVTRGLRGAADPQPLLLRLGTPPEYFQEVAFPRLAAGGLRLIAQWGVPATLLDALLHGEVDLVIASQRLATPGIQYENWETETFCLVGPADLAVPPEIVVGPDSWDLLEAWLREQPWIVYGADLPIIRRFWQAAFGRRPLVQPRFILPDLRTILWAVEHGGGLSVLPTYLCAASLAAGRIRILWAPPDPVTNEIWLAYRRSDAAAPLIRRACQLLRPA